MYVNKSHCCCYAFPGYSTAPRTIDRHKSALVKNYPTQIQERVKNAVNASNPKVTNNDWKQ